MSELYVMTSSAQEIACVGGCVIESGGKSKLCK